MVSQFGSCSTSKNVHGVCGSGQKFSAWILDDRCGIFKSGVSRTFEGVYIFLLSLVGALEVFLLAIFRESILLLKQNQ